MPTSDEFHSVQWRSWQPPDLREAEADMPAPVIELDNPPSEEKLQAELARLRKQAEQQGYAKGLEQGREEGRQQGYAAGHQQGLEAGTVQGKQEAHTQQQALLRQAEQWVESFKLSLDSLDSVVPSRLVQLALHAVNVLQGTSRLTDASGLLENIRQLMQQDALLQGRICLRIHPQDQPFVMSGLGEQLTAMGWTLQTDEQIAPGGCQLTSDDMELDATLETRWQTLCQLAHEALKS